MINIDHLSKLYNARYLFSDVSFNVATRDRIGVIGNNGAGKTTLFEIISGNISPDSGSISMHRGVTVGYLKQDVHHTYQKKLLDEVVSSSTNINYMSRKIQILHEELAEEKDEENIATLLKELGELQTEFETIGGFNAEQDARVILSGLGFDETEFNRPILELSGGWRTRVELAKLLYLKPDLLILDEPTNHLDLETIRWFENYLKGFRGAVMVTSHDRAFLNKVVSKIIAIESDEVVLFNGDYNEYILAREKDKELKQAIADRQEIKIKKEMRFIERFRYKKTKARQVQSRIKRLEKIERVVVPRSTRKINFTFPEPPRSGRSVITLEGISKSYGEKPVYKDLNLQLLRGDKVALVGPNGAGKTTLLKILAGVLPFEKGTRTPGYNVTASYFAQYYIDQLNPENSVIDEIRQVAPDEPEQKLRGVLGAFLFGGDDVFKKVAVLSGGEKTRVALARMLTRPANFLLLDEPTNHLDIPSREILSDALQDYTGTMCLITHDRTLIREVATKIIDIRDGDIRVFPGSYDEYLYAVEQSKAEDEDLLSNNSLSGSKAARESAKARQQRKAIEGELRNRYYRDVTPVRDRLAWTEAEITRLSQQLKEIEAMLVNPDNYKDSKQAFEMSRDYRMVKEKIDTMTAEWEELSDKADKLMQQYEQEKGLTE
jgi:ATP-binding cassette subfamily F protein 3